MKTAILCILLSLPFSAVGYAMGLRAELVLRVAEAWTLAVDNARGVVCHSSADGVRCDITRNDGKVMPVLCDEPSVFSITVTCGQRPGTLEKEKSQ